jgi:hypothetical protein
MSKDGPFWNDPNVKIVETSPDTYAFRSYLAPTVQIEGDLETGRVIVTIDGIRFVTQAEDRAQAVALAERVSRALGFRFEPEEG